MSTPTARPRARPRPSAQERETVASDLPSATSAPAATEDDASNPRIARMRQALELTAAGRSQDEIGRLMSCAPRTVRDLLKEGRKRKLHTFKATSAEAIVADAEYRHATNYARLTTLWVKAKNSGNLKLEAIALSLLEKAVSNRIATLARVGFFDGVTFSTGNGGTAQVRDAKRARKEIDDMVRLLAATNRGDDIDLLNLAPDDDDDEFDPDDLLY